MSKIIILLITAFTALTTIHDFKLKDINGRDINLGNFRGKKILLVNTATHSRFANQFSSLEQLYQKYKDSLVIIAVPSNSFGNEPDSSDVIKSIMQGYYHVHYLIADKMGVTGLNQSPVYNWLTKTENNGRMNSTVNNDFQKYLIDANGNLMGYFIPSVNPMDSLVQKAIENKLISH